MLPVVVMMVLILLLAGLVVLYVAYPHRGERIPAAPWLGEAMSKAVEAAPVIVGDGQNTHEGSRLHDELETAAPDGAAAARRRAS